MLWCLFLILVLTNQVHGNGEQELNMEEFALESVDRRWELEREEMRNFATNPTLMSNITRELQAAMLYSQYVENPVGVFQPLGDGIADLGYVVIYSPLDFAALRVVLLSAAMQINAGNVPSDVKEEFVADLQSFDAIYHHFGMGAINKKNKVSHSLV